MPSESVYDVYSMIASHESVMFRASTAQMFPLISIVMLAAELFLHQRGWKEHGDLDMLAVHVIS